MSEPTGTTLSLRGQRQRERVERSRAHVRPGIRVVPANDDMRRVLKHPTRGGFRGKGSVEWPDDHWTRRRLLDGSIKREEQKREEHRREEQPEAPAHKSDKPDKSAQHQHHSPQSGGESA